MTPKELLDKIDEIGYDKFIEDGFDFESEEFSGVEDWPDRLATDLEELWHAIRYFNSMKYKLYDSLEKEVYNVG